MRKLDVPKKNKDERTMGVDGQCGHQVKKKEDGRPKKKKRWGNAHLF